MKTLKEYLRETTMGNTNSGIKLLQQVINDEISASILYQKINNQLKGSQFSEFRTQMGEHSKDEHSHFSQLLEISSQKFPTINLNISITPDGNYNIQPGNIIQYTQQLEQKAINDYKQLIEFAIYLNDTTLEDIFRKILKDEEEHFNDVNMIGA